MNMAAHYQRMPSNVPRCKFATGHSNRWAVPCMLHRKSRRAALVCKNFSSTTSDRPTAVSNTFSERILRYPDGYERRIIYPVTAEPQVDFVDDDVQFSKSAESADDDDFQDHLLWDECSLSGAACNANWATAQILTGSATETATSASRISSKAHSVVPAQSAPSTLLPQTPEELKQMVKDSYQILAGCPWLVSRPLYVLALQHQHSDGASLYVLQARLQKEGFQDELARVLNKSSLANSFTYSEMKEGAVAFETEEDAERYATFLEADTGMETTVLEMDSHDLFRTMGDVLGVVVHIPQARYLPLPHQLSASLRGRMPGFEGMQL